MANILYENGFPIKAIVNGKLVDVQEVRHGHWEPISRGEVGYSAGDFRCTVCGTPNKCYSMTPYCPNCGAKMVNEDE